jgi:hypothetical protein
LLCSDVNFRNCFAPQSYRKVMSYRGYVVLGKFGRLSAALIAITLGLRALRSRPEISQILIHRLLSATNESDFFRASPLSVFLLHDDFLSLIYSTFSPFSGSRSLFPTCFVSCSCTVHKLRPLLDTIEVNNCHYPASQCKQTGRYIHILITTLLSYFLTAYLLFHFLFKSSACFPIAIRNPTSQNGSPNSN